MRDKKVLSCGLCIKGDDVTLEFSVALCQPLQSRQTCVQGEIKSKADYSGDWAPEEGYNSAV